MGSHPPNNQAKGVTKAIGPQRPIASQKDGVTPQRKQAGRQASTDRNTKRYVSDKILAAISRLT